MNKEIVATYFLRDKDDLVVAKLDLTTCEGHAIIGECYTGLGLIGDTNELYDMDFHSRVYCKFDACTHWSFYGEDYEKDLNNPDSYYHLCGTETFVPHIRAMCFVWKVAEIVTDQSYINYYTDGETCSKLVELMLDGYTIEKKE